VNLKRSDSIRVISDQISESDSVLPLEDAACRIASVVLTGGIVLYPSDTVYGMLCRADDQQVLTRLCRIKGYQTSRPFIMLVEGLVMAGTVADCSDPEIMGIMQCRWPGKLTLVLPASAECPEYIKGEDDTVALRYPADKLSNLILSECGMPLVSTSANTAGGSNYLNVEDIPDCIKEEVDMIADAGTLPVSSPSTVLHLLRSQGMT